MRASPITSAVNSNPRHNFFAKGTGPAQVLFRRLIQGVSITAASIGNASADGAFE